jgi:hypothetical protein
VHAFEEQDAESRVWRRLALDAIDPSILPPELRDQRLLRWGDVEAIPWFFAWGCNFSAPTRTLRELDGFAASLVDWGWDDLELAFRLELAGVATELVEPAEAVHFPHPRAPIRDRWATATANWLRTYEAHRHPTLELWPTCWYWDYGPLLSGLAARLEAVPPHHRARPPSALAAFGDRATVWFGFAGDDAARQGPSVGFARPARGRPAQAGESFGLRTPFPDANFQTAVVSEAYLSALAFHVNPVLLPLSQHAMREAVRVAHQVVVVAPELRAGEAIETYGLARGAAPPR